MCQAALTAQRVGHTTGLLAASRPSPAHRPRRRAPRHPARSSPASSPSGDVSASRVPRGYRGDGRPSARPTTPRRAETHAASARPAPPPAPKGVKQTVARPPQGPLFGRQRPTHRHTLPLQRRREGVARGHDRRHTIGVNVRALQRGPVLVGQRNQPVEVFGAGRRATRPARCRRSAVGCRRRRLRRCSGPSAGRRAPSQPPPAAAKRPLHRARRRANSSARAATFATRPPAPPAAPCRPSTDRAPPVLARQQDRRPGVPHQVRHPARQALVVKLRRERADIHKATSAHVRLHFPSIRVPSVDCPVRPCPHVRTCLQGTYRANLAATLFVRPHTPGASASNFIAIGGNARGGSSQFARRRRGLRAEEHGSRGGRYDLRRSRRGLSRGGHGLRGGGHDARVGPVVCGRADTIRASGSSPSAVSDRARTATSPTGVGAAPGC